MLFLIVIIYLRCSLTTFVNVFGALTLRMMFLVLILSGVYNILADVKCLIIRVKNPFCLPRLTAPSKESIKHPLNIQHRSSIKFKYIVFFILETNYN